jgi:predicted nucleic acid-binding protein
MAGLIVVSDSSSLIALWQIRLIDRIAPLYATLLIPPAVAFEIRPSVGSLTWAEIQAPADAIDARILRAGLGAGETEAIALAMEYKPDRVILDDLKARRLAMSLGLPVGGTLGLLLDAKQAVLINEIKPSIEDLLQVGFHLSLQVVDRILRDSGE